MKSLREHELMEICQECDSYEITDKRMVSEGEAEPFTKFCKYCDLWLCFPCFDEHKAEIHQANEVKSVLERPNLPLGALLLALLTFPLFLGCNGLNRITGAPEQKNQKAQFFTVSCCRDNNNGILTYPSFLPPSQVQLCQEAKINGDNINGDVYLAMSVDCGHGHHSIGDNYYPSIGY